MKNKITGILLIILTVLFCSGVSGETVSFKISVTLPEHPGVNTNQHLPAINSVRPSEILTQDKRTVRNNQPVLLKTVVTR